jgi:hypothetical protein
MEEEVVALQERLNLDMDDEDGDDEMDDEEEDSQPS